MQLETEAREVRKESKAKLAAVIKKFTKESVGHQGLWKIATKKNPADDKAQNLPIECEMWPGQPDGLLPIANSNKLKRNCDSLPSLSPQKNNTEKMLSIYIYNTYI